MRKLTLLFFLTLVYSLLLVSLCGDCDEICLKNGNSVMGVIEKESEETVIIKSRIGFFTIPMKDVEKIVMATEEENRLLSSAWMKNDKDVHAIGGSGGKPVSHIIVGSDGNKNKMNGKDKTNESWYDFSKPESAFSSFMRACQMMDFEKSDLCYTKEFQKFAKTDKIYMSHRNKGQLNNAYNYWNNRHYELEVQGRKAIMRFSPPFERPEPIYFVKEADGWKIDGMFSFNNVIIENSKNWHWKNPDSDNEKLWLNK